MVGSFDQQERGHTGMGDVGLMIHDAYDIGSSKKQQNNTFGLLRAEQKTKKVDVLNFFHVAECARETRR